MVGGADASDIVALDEAIRFEPGDTREVPLVAFAGTREVLPPGAARTITGQRVAVVVGHPIDVVGKDRDALMAVLGDAR